MSEDIIQFQCYVWFHNTFPEKRGLFFSVPNGGSRNKKEANKLKATGVVAGIPDLIYMYKNGYGIEIKTEEGTLSEKQKEIHEIWKENGKTVYVCRSLEEFQVVITEIHSY